MQRHHLQTHKNHNRRPTIRNRNLPINPRQTMASKENNQRITNRNALAQTTSAQPYFTLMSRVSARFFPPFFPLRSYIVCDFCYNCYKALSIITLIKNLDKAKSESAEPKKQKKRGGLRVTSPTKVIYLTPATIQHSFTDSVHFSRVMLFSFAEEFAAISLFSCSARYSISPKPSCTSSANRA